MSLKAVLFDLDGTLLDTAPDFVTTVNKLLAEESHQNIDADKIRRTVSNGARALIKMSFGIEVDHPNFDRLLARLLEIYSEHLSVDTVLFPGIEDVLALLKRHNIPWGIVTNKTSAYTLPIVAAMEFDPAPQSVVCPDHVTHTKPDPEPLFLACHQLGCHPNDIIYIGDHLRDIDCGKRAGSPTIAAAYGYIADDDIVEDWQADYIVHHASEMIPIIESYL